MKNFLKKSTFFSTMKYKWIQIYYHQIQIWCFCIWYVHYNMHLQMVYVCYDFVFNFRRWKCGIFRSFSVLCTFGDIKIIAYICARMIKNDVYDTAKNDIYYGLSITIDTDLIYRSCHPNFLIKGDVAGWIFRQYHIPYYLHPMRCTISYI